MSGEARRAGTGPRGLPGLQGAVWRWWERPRGTAGRLFSILTFPLELLFRLGVAARNLAYGVGAASVDEASIPVISVGNLAVGGTGKTPVAAWVVDRLLEGGARPVLVSRGYGVDEVELHRRWHPGVPVATDARRIRAIREAVEAGADVAVLDDGFQHRALARDLDVVLLAAEHPLPPRLLPRGPYREPLRALGRADLAVLTRRTADEERANRLEAAIREAAPGIPLARVRLAPRDWTDLEGSPADAPEGPVLAVASVARPGDFARLVREETGADVELRALPDHHDYTPSDVEQIAGRAGGRTVTTTEKDAVKLAAFGDRLGPVRVLRLQVTFERGREELARALASLAAEAP